MASKRILLKKIISFITIRATIVAFRPQRVKIKWAFVVGASVNRNADPSMLVSFSSSNHLYVHILVVFKCLCVIICVRIIKNDQNNQIQYYSDVS